MNELRMVYSNRWDRFELVDKNDRDYQYGFTMDFYLENGFEVCKQIYLRPTRLNNLEITK